MALRPVPFYAGDTTRCVCPNCEEVVDIIPPFPLDEIQLRAFHTCNPGAVVGRQLADLRDAKPGEA